MFDAQLFLQAQAIPHRQLCSIYLFTGKGNDNSMLPSHAPWRHRAGADIWLHSFLTLALDNW